MVKITKHDVTQLVVLLLFAAGTNDLHAETQSPQVSFSRQIRPLLADKCLACHGADAKNRAGGLRLDLSESAYIGGESGEPAIVRGRPTMSELVRRIESTHQDVQMPPSHSHKVLSDKEKRLLKDWIAQGGDYERHWAFSPPVRTPLPEVKFASWPQNEIDRYTLSNLEEKGLRPSPVASKVTLLRRLTLDLTGLPPTLEELDEFVADPSSDAYDRTVQRLLKSSHYGERWGRLWLDAARYADSDGYEKDKPRFVWAYRDWVVRSLNQDLPYSQFIIEQLAGDLLPDATQDQLVATGFLRNSMLNEEGGVDPEQFRMEAMFDRIDAIGKSILGLTIQCCQCHDHKFDPISQKEYYQLFAFLNDVSEASAPVYSVSQQTERARLFTEMGALEGEIQQLAPDWAQQLAAWETTIAVPKTTWWTVTPKQEVSGGQKHYVLANGEILAQGYAPTKTTSEFVVTTPVETVTAVRLELLTHADLPLGGPGRALDGTCALTEFEIEAGPANDSAGLASMKILSATADVNPPEELLAPQFDDRSNRRRMTGPISFAIDGNRDTAWSIRLGPNRSNVAREAVLVLKNPLTFQGGTKLRLKLVQLHGGWNSDDNQTNCLGCYRFSVANTDTAAADLIPNDIRRILQKRTSERTVTEQRHVFSFWRTTVPEFACFNQKIESLWRQLPVPTTQLVLKSRDEPRKSFVLSRGNFLQPTLPVAKQVPSMLHPLSIENPTRLNLARWLVDDKSPTVARSIVNRVWQTYFGTGLVATSEDFGLQGEPPSHPELLDWLAVELMEQGWSLKHLHTLIVTSATYRQSSHVSPEHLSRDPDNRLLARSSRFRMEAEGIRDISLTASGLINLEVGGAPVFPPCPEFLFRPPASYGPKEWPLATDASRYRRGLYTFRFRSVPHPVLQMFDAPTGEVSCVRRVKSNTPLQALTALNEPLFLDCARGLAESIMRDASHSDDKRLTMAFRRCTSRFPDNDELSILVSFLKQQRERMARGELSPQLIASKTSRSEDDMPDADSLQELAAWTVVCRVLLNLDEAITRE